jgi:hypothetical protein
VRAGVRLALSAERLGALTVPAAPLRRRLRVFVGRMFVAVARAGALVVRSCLLVECVPAQFRDLGEDLLGADAVGCAAVAAIRGRTQLVSGVAVLGRPGAPVSAR